MILSQNTYRVVILHTCHCIYQVYVVEINKCSNVLLLPEQRHDSEMIMEILLFSVKKNVYKMHCSCCLPSKGRCKTFVSLR